MLELFPDLKQFWNKKSGLLSGGQKQMLAISRAFINSDGLLLIDEPSKRAIPDNGGEINGSYFEDERENNSFTC